MCRWMLPVLLVLAVLQRGDQPPAPPARDLGGFVDCVSLSGRFAIMDGTQTVYNGKDVPWEDIPDDNTEPVEVTIDLKRRMITRIVYRTVRDF